ncbi:MAG: hypothetical protein WA873_08130 [Jannaschia helgolandensis]
MQFDRLMMKTVTRLARSGIAGLRSTSVAATGKEADASGPRGSGSWANEWSGAKSAVAKTAVERAKSLARPGKSRTKSNAPQDAIPEGTIRTRPLMSVRNVKLHNWIADRMEAEAPTCSLHACVALNSFLTSLANPDGTDPLTGLTADLLIVDEHGQPVVALIREKAADPSQQLMVIDALLDADLPIVDIPARPSLSGLWASIAETLPKD